MKEIVKFIKEGLKITSKTKVNKIPKYNYHPKNSDELCDLIKDLIKERGEKADLNDIDISNITNLNDLFWDIKFNGDISDWDVSNVREMEYMFFKCPFNGDISKWDVSNVTNMEHMFYHSEFNGDISDWDISKVKNMKDMFKGCPLEKNPPKWYKK